MSVDIEGQQEVNARRNSSQPSCTTSNDNNSVRDLLACQFHHWYPIFYSSSSFGQQQKRKRVTIPSVILDPLPDDFIEYLMSDGIKLPQNATRLSSALSCNNKNGSSDDDDDDDWSTSSSSSSSHTESSSSDCDKTKKKKEFCFDKLNQDIQTAIDKECKGKALVKCNWSAPRDATWIHGGTMACRYPGDVYLLLKSSDFILHDVETISNIQQQLHQTNQDEHLKWAIPPTNNVLQQGHENITDSKNDNTDEYSVTNHHQRRKQEKCRLYLVLRKWCLLNPSTEFRCFVAHQQLIAISQRHASQHYPHLQLDQEKHRRAIVEFYKEYIQPRLFYKTTNRQQQQQEENVSSSLWYFPNNFVMDVYIESKRHLVWLIDFNIWSPTQTDGLLFDWNTELQSWANSITTTASSNNENEFPILRVVETERAIRHDPLASYRAPMDAVDLAMASTAESNHDVVSFDDFMKQCVKPTSRDNDSVS